MNILEFEPQSKTPFVRKATAALCALLLGVQAHPRPRQRSSREGVCGLDVRARDLRRFWPKVEVMAGCWVWRGFVAPNGYGRFRLKEENRLAHRVAYEMFVGKLPEGLTIDHLCRNKRCVNPAHLEPVTHQENVRRAIEARDAA